MNIRSSFAPVDSFHIAFQKRSVSCFCFALFFRLSFTSFDIFDNFQKQFCTFNFKFVVQFAHGHIFTNGYNNFFNHVTGIHTDIHLHNGYATFFFTLHDCIVNRRSTSVLGKQRSVHIDATIFRHGKYFLGKQLTKCSNYNQIRVHFTQLCNELRSFNALGLMNFVALAQSVLLNRSHQHLTTASFRSIRLGNYTNNFIFTCFCQSLQAAYGKIRSSHKNYTHIFHLLI